MAVASRIGAAEVLVVDDDESLRESLVDVLEGDGITVAGAASGVEALSYLRGHPAPCLIFLDLMMPGMDGWELAQLLQSDAELASIPVVLLSAVTDLQRQVPAVHADGYLRKPVDARFLIEVARGYVRKR